MPQILLDIKNSVNRKDLIEGLRKQNSVDLVIHQEPPQREPLIAKAPLGPVETQAAAEIIKQLFSAQTMVEIIVIAPLSNAVNALIGKSWKYLMGLISANNEQRGNRWGAQLILERQTSEQQKQKVHFFLDNIPEASLKDALEKTTDRLKNLEESLGQEYLDRVKEIGFSYNQEFGNWELRGVELQNGNVEIPSEGLG